MAADRKKPILSGIQDKVGDGVFEFSQHATDQTIVRGIRVQEIREAVAAGELIEDYADDKYGPSCLILGFTASGRPLHIHCSYPSRPVIKLITIYEPDPSRWIDSRKRRQDHD